MIFNGFGMPKWSQVGIKISASSCGEKAQGEGVGGEAAQKAGGMIKLRRPYKYTGLFS